MMTTTPDFRGNDRFSLVRRLGAGGMGVVFHAIDRERGAEVALKTLKFLDAAAIYHLKQEFRALADVRHPNLVRLHDLVSDAGHWFFTMDLVEGEDFLEHVRGKTAAAIPSPDTIDAPLPPDESTAERVDLGSLGRQRLSLSPLLDVGRLREALRQVAEGVAALHATHKLHRDLKPSNVMVRRDGRVVILDFGLAKDLHDGGSLQSIDQHVLGTPEYMSPEQGAARPLGPAADWYSVGVMLFEALTGGLPFVGSSLDILMAKEREDGPAPSRFVNGIPADLDRLCELLLRRRPQDRPPSDEILRRLGSIPITHDSSPRTSAAPPSLGGIVAPSSPFVGRTAARTSLDLAFRRSRQGRAVAAHLHGGAGVGKSALVRAFLEDAAVQHHALVLAGACFEREMVPFKAVDSVIDALSRHLRRLSRLQVEALLPREIHALSRLFPVLERVEAVAGAPALDYESPDRAEARRRAFAALRELLARIADRRPLVIAIEDLQWGDTDSIALLGDLLRPPYPPPFLLVATYRDESGNPTLDALKDLHLEERPLAASVGGEVVDLRASSTARRRRRSSACEVHDLPLAPLDEDESRELARSLLEGAHVPLEHVPEVVEGAGGNPLLLVELVGWLREHPAEALSGTRASLDAVVQGRLDRVGSAGRRLVETAAIAGRPLRLPMLGRAAGTDADRDTVTVLCEQRLLRPVRSMEGDRIVTFHERIRDSILQHLSPEVIADGHLRLAHAIEAAGDDESEALAEHFRLAGAKWRASHYAAKAALRAQEALAFERAAALFRTAIELAPPNAPELPSLRLQLGDVLSAAGRGVEAAQAYMAAAEGVGANDRLELHRRAAQQLLSSGHVDDGLAVYEEVLGSMGEKLPGSPRMALAQLFFRRAQLRLRGLDFVERQEAEVPADDLVRIDTYWALAAGMSMVNNVVGSDLNTRHTLLALRAGEPYRVARALSVEAGFVALGGSANKERFEHLLARLEPITERVQNHHTQGLLEAIRAYGAYFNGRFSAARPHFEEAERIFRERCAGVSWELANVRVLLIGNLSALGAMREICERLPQLLEEADRRGDLLALTNLRVGQASLAWAVHDDAAAGRKDVRDALKRWSQREFLLQHYYAMASLSLLDLYGGDARSAHQRVEKRWSDLERSQLLRIQRVRVEALHLRAAAAVGALGTGNKSLDLVRLAERCLRKIEDERLAWADPLAWSIRATLAASAGGNEEAELHLRRAVAGFEAAGMMLYATAARRRLGVVLGGDDGRKLVKAADAWMGAEDILDPVRMTEMMLPGF